MALSRFVRALCASTVLAATAGCGGGGGPKDATEACGGTPRPQLDCESEFSYDGRSVQGSFSALGLADLDGKTEVKALREIDTETERYVAQSRRLCDEYNKCVIDRATYSTRSENLRRRLARVPELRERLRDAPDLDARRRELASAYDALVASAAPLTLTFTVSAAPPGEAQPGVVPLGGPSTVVGEGATLRTGSRVAFTVQVSRNAHVYLFQRTKQSAVRVLFPDPRIGIPNPLPGSKPMRIPDGDRFFRLDENDVGRERVYLVASEMALPSLERAGEALRAGAPEPPAVTELTKLEPGPPGCRPRALVLEDGAELPPCARPRGLVLEGSGPSAPPASYVIRTEAADTLVAGTFSFEHVQ